MSTALILSELESDDVFAVRWANGDACKPRGGTLVDLEQGRRLAMAFDDGAWVAVRRLLDAGILHPHMENLARRHAGPTYADVRNYLEGDNGYHPIVAAGIALYHTRADMNRELRRALRRDGAIVGWP